MDRKNSLRQSPITWRSNDGSAEKSFFSDSDSVQSVVAVSSARNVEDDIECTSQAATVLESKTSEESDDEESSSSSSSSNRSDEELMKFGSGKRALEHDASSAFFSTAVYDDDYLSDRRPSSSSSDRYRSKSVSPVDDKTGGTSRDSLLNSATSTVGGDRFRPGDNDDDVTMERSPSPSMVNGGTSTYRSRDGIPKYVMLPNPFYRETGLVRPGNDSDRMNHLRLSSNSDGMVVPPEIPCRRDAADGVPVTVTGAPRLPVITVTETSGGGDGDGGEDDCDGGSPKSFLKKIFVPSLAPSSERRYEPPHTEFAETVAVVKHYGDIVERYSEMAAKKIASKTYYLDFEQLRMAAAVEDEPAETTVAEPAEAETDGTSELDDADETLDDDRTTNDGDEYRMPAAVDDNDNDARLQLVVAYQESVAQPPDAIPYLKVFGNLSLALFGYWLYTCKDERLSVPVFGFLLFRFFKTQVWDRI